LLRRRGIAAVTVLAAAVGGALACAGLHALCGAAAWARWWCCMRLPHWLRSYIVRTSRELTGRRRCYEG
jgi:hypothetical protein